MAIDDDLKIFISWSGDLARECTKVLREWLPKMFDRIDPWASDVDIDAGLRGLDVVQDRLNASSFGIIVVTTENMGKSWLNFEAGALSKRLEGEATPVVPLLVNFEDVYQLQGPISQFQAIKLDKEGMSRLCRSIAAVIGLDPLTIDARFEWAWPDLETAIERAKKSVGEQPEPPEIEEKDLLKVMYRSIQSLERQVVALGDSGIPQSALSTPLYLRSKKYRDELSPGNDDLFLQAALDKIELMAAKYKPVSSVTLMEGRNGKKVVGIKFRDGEGLDVNDLNELVNEAMMIEGVPIAVVTDHDINARRLPGG